ncbi:blastoderm-specific protein 25D isoform X2 [Drosophila erecta]|uniref:blastoderm-specific protein 25D isoform X2 n=1 Tax=Drosophila erecta TaxID=7220 RepID=UPI000F0715B9|nr:blastoderm-specific protein 25D isoform X2 [Drosophila erecta]
MEVSADPYEQKLYQMFRSCETQCGLLDEKSLLKLCSLLELRDQGSALIASLGGSHQLGVSFGQFKEALLNFLGSEFDGTTSSGFIERSLVITDEPLTSTYIESPPESSDREVSPKLVVGTKKYGRRSRPQQGIYELSVTDSDNTDEDQLQQEKQRSLNGCDELGVQVQRSSSQSDLPGSRRLRSVHTSGSKLKRCASLPARRKINSNSTGAATSPTAAAKLKHLSIQSQAQHSSSVESLGKLPLASNQPELSQISRSPCPCHPLLLLAQNAKITFEAMIKVKHLSVHNVGHHLAANPAPSSEHWRCYHGGRWSCCKDTVTPQQLETISVHSIIEAWELASIPNTRNLLHVLGFDEEEEVNLQQLTKALEEEMRGLDGDHEQSNMLRALAALQAAELGNYRVAYRQQHEENLKLRADNKAANQRVALLAVEVDERHASLEDSSKKQVQQLEQRHASMVRELTLRMSNDRDHWTSMTGKLEAQLKSLEQEEIRLRTELELVRTENLELESEQQKAHIQLTELLEQNIKLNQELAHRPSSISGTPEHSPMRPGRHSEDKEEEMLQLMEKLAALQMENAQLRDKTDELTIEIESLNVELIRSKTKGKKQEKQEKQEDQESAATATKRRGDSPSKTHLTEESPRLGKQRKCTEGEQSDASNSGDWLALNSELQRSQSQDEELTSLRQRVAELEKELKAAREGRSLTPESRSKELEASLEQMQRAYEECEDYWQTKLSEERQLFEKERQIYEDEQHESDKKFTELMEKVREYEEQFSKDGRLSPIDERDMLEQQYSELEAEAAQLRSSSIEMLEEKAHEISSLQSEIEDLRQRLGESVEILTGACELTSESVAQLSAEAGKSPASSPISYLWLQSTIQEPAKSLADSKEEATASAIELLGGSPSHKTASRTTPFESSQSGPSPTNSGTTNASGANAAPAPISKPKRAQSPQIAPSEGEIADCETSSTASNKSFESNSKTSCLSHEKCSSPSALKEELKRLKFFELSLKEQIKDLSLQRDGLVMELQQLQEARPVLEKAYARTTHPTLQQRLNQLELRNRHLQNVIKQQQQYTESLMQQSWRQHQVELNDLHSRIETQGVLLADQTQRLQSADILVKDLYVENSHLTATVQRLEQQRARVNLIHQQQQQQRLVGGGLPGMP